MNPHMLGKPRLRAARCANDQRHRSPWESICSTQSRLRAKSPCLRTPPGIPGFWRELNLWTHVCSESPDCELQDTPMIGAIGACGGSICTIQCCLRVKTPFFGSPPVTPGFLAEIEPVDPRMLGKPRLQAARCANDQRHRSMWGEYMPDSVLFEGQNASGLCEHL